VEEKFVALEEDVVVKDILNAHIVKKWVLPKKTATFSIDFLTR